MSIVNIRKLARHPSKVIDEVRATGRPAIITSDGRAVAALVPLEGEAMTELMEDWILTMSPQAIREMMAAEDNLLNGRVRSGEEVRSSHEAKKSSI